MEARLYILGIKGSVTNEMVPDTTGHLRSFCIHASKQLCQHKLNIFNIRQVVLMYLVTGVYQVFWTIMLVQ